MAKLGFQQQESRKTVFKAEAGEWGIFVDFESSHETRVRESHCEPSIYILANDDGSDHELVLSAAAEILDDAGIPHRKLVIGRSPAETTHCPICGEQDCRVGRRRG